MKSKKILIVFAIKFFKEAELEIVNACAWYEEKLSGLGSRLRDEMDEYLSIIEVNPICTQINMEIGFGLPL